MIDERRDRLAGAGFADDRDDLAAVDGVARCPRPRARRRARSRTGRAGPRPRAAARSLPLRRATVSATFPLTYIEHCLDCALAISRCSFRSNGRHPGAIAAHDGWADGRAIVAAPALGTDVAVRLRRRPRVRDRLRLSPISRRISSVCSPSRGEGRSAAIGAPPIMIGVRTPGIVPSLAAALGRSSLHAAVRSPADRRTPASVLIGPAGTPTASSLARMSRAWRTSRSAR